MSGMSADERAILLQTSAAVAALRRVLVHLLAIEARRRRAPGAMFETISNDVAATTRNAAKGEAPDDPTAVQFQVMVQSEVDELIGEVRQLLARRR